MMIFLVASIFAVAICFAGVPSAVNDANEVHIRNGREPNAGVSIAPGLIVMIVIWVIGTSLLDRYLGRSWAWVLLLAISTFLLGKTLLGARASNREYSSFIRSRPGASWPSYLNGMVATQRWTHPGGEERLYLISKPDGTFTTGHEKYCEDEHEKHWASYGPCSIYDSKETAIKEALVEHRWMADVKPERKGAEAGASEAQDPKDDP